MSPCRDADRDIGRYHHRQLTGDVLANPFRATAHLDQGSGTVVNIASQTRIKGSAELVHYSAAKGGVIALTWALVREVEIHPLTPHNCSMVCSRFPGATDPQRA